MYIVTGAAGFIGSALVWELNQQGINQIICVDRYRDEDKWKNLAKLDFVDFIHAESIYDFIANPEVIDQVQGVFHLGAISHTTEMDMDKLMDQNYYLSQALFQWCLEFDKKFVYASSAATYGDGEKGFSDFTDSRELVPLNKYGYSKVLFDRWVDKQTKLPPVCAGLKFFNVYGPQEYHKGGMKSVVFNAVKQINETGKMKLFKSHHPDYKDGEQMRDFVYVKDITRWMTELMKMNDVTGLFNMGYGQARTWKDLVNCVFASMGKESNIEYIDIPDHLINQYQYFTEADISKLKEVGLSTPQWPIEEGVKDYVKNYLLNKDMYL